MSDNHNETPENCTHDCSTCGEACAHEHEAESMQQPLRPGSRVDKVIAVVSGKGGVGKSMTSALLACKLPAFEAAVCAVYLHGAAADRAAAKHGEAGMLPHDLFAELGGLFAANGR